MLEPVIKYWIREREHNDAKINAYESVIMHCMKNNIYCSDFIDKRTELLNRAEVIKQEYKKINDER